jgi:hypothetical protein
VADEIKELAGANNETAIRNHDFPALWQEGHWKASRRMWAVAEALSVSLLQETDNMDAIYIAFAAVFIGIVAHMRGRNGVLWFVLTIALAFGFGVVVVEYMQGSGAGHAMSLLMAIPFIYGSPIATFLILIAIGRPAKSAEKPALKSDPLAAMTRKRPTADDYFLG